MAGIIGDLLDTVSGGGYGEAQDINQQLVNDAKNLPLPILKEYYPELYKTVVSMNPELETAEKLGPSAMEGISTDPKLREAQMNALNKLSSIGEAGGRDSQFLADQARMEADINANLQGQQGAVTQNLATRGLSGGMSELVAKNINSQGAANRQSQMAMDEKAAADKRALDAIIQSGNMGGQIQAQDFSQKSQQAQAADMINKFNAQNSQDVQSRNVNSKNQAQQLNAANTQKTSDQNVGVKNQATQYNQNLTQQQYDNELKKRGLVNSASKDLANSYSNEADRNRQVVGGLIGAGSKAYSGGAF